MSTDVVGNNYDIGTNANIESTYERLIQNPYLIDALTLNGSNDAVQIEFVPYEKFKYLNDVRNAICICQTSIWGTALFCSCLSRK